MTTDDKAVRVCPVSPVDARELGRETQLTLEDGHVYIMLASPPTASSLSPFRSQLYKAFNTTFKLMVFLLEKKNKRLAFTTWNGCKL